MKLITLISLFAFMTACSITPYTPYKERCDAPALTPVEVKCPTLVPASAPVVNVRIDSLDKLCGLNRSAPVSKCPAPTKIKCKLPSLDELNKTSEFDIDAYVNDPNLLIKELLRRQQDLAMHVANINQEYAQCQKK